MNVLEKILEEIELEQESYENDFAWNYSQGLKHAKEIIRSHMVAKDANVWEWIPVEERLPKDNNDEFYDSVIVTLDSGRVAEGIYRVKDKEWWVDAPSGHHFSENKTGHVVAWVPFPKRYRVKV